MYVFFFSKIEKKYTTSLGIVLKTKQVVLCQEFSDMSQLFLSRLLENAAVFDCR